MTDNKVCSKCNTAKSISMFGQYKCREKVKTRGICNECRVKIEGERSRADRSKPNMRNRQYKQVHKEKVRVAEAERVKHKRNNDIQFKLCSNVSGRTRTVLIMKDKQREVELIGCSSTQLKKWVEFQFDDKMNWDNYATYWNIDHVIPLTAFDMQYRSQQLLACNWTNIRPVEVLTNKLKSNKLLKDVIDEHMTKLEHFVSLNGYQTSIATCWWQRHILWYGKNPEDERNYDDFLKRIIRNDNTNEQTCDRLV